MYAATNKIGAMLGQENMEKRMPPVGREIEDLEKALAYLAENLERLEIRLSAVMAPVPQGVLEGKPIRDCGASQMSGILNRLAREAHGQAVRVGNLIDCLEI